jgi:hypothetical protein
MDTSIQQLWGAPTPIIASHHSPAVDNSQSISPFGPLSNGSMSSPILNVTELASTRGFLLRSPMPRIPQWNEAISGLPHSFGALNEFNLGVAQASDCALEESMSRLMQLVNKRETIVESDSLVRLRCDLQTLKNYAQIANPPSTLSEMPGNSLDHCEPEEVSNVLEELKLANSLLLATLSVVINCNGMIHCID